ncbi:MAG: hypothetical protein IKJ81_08175 [Bacteroidales bacterium]|nr:hypothetical protein [Bacteroidales bacterium]
MALIGLKKNRCFLIIITPLLTISFFLFSSAVEYEGGARSSLLEVKKNIYDIDRIIDLQGRTIDIPYNYTLLFSGGKIINGTINGNNTSIISDKKQIFSNVTITGTWKNSVVYSEWLSFSEDSTFDNRDNFLNLMALCKGDLFTTVYLKEGNYWTSTRKNGYAISIPSNTRLVFKGTLNEIPNDFEATSLVRIYHVDNVVVDGGSYYGDAKCHIGNRGEWSHGISICGSSNVIIKNTSCYFFWGDGIDMIEAFDSKEEPVYNCSNVIIDSCKCLYNRRQGLSIESVHHCVVMNSEFSHTGSFNNTPPSAGIDVEAWANNNEKIKDVTIYNCFMKDNKGFSLQSYSNAVLGNNYQLYSNDIKVIKCKMDDVLIDRTNAIFFVDCEIKSTPIVRNSEKVFFINSSYGIIN